MKVLLRFDDYFILFDCFYREVSFKLRRLGFYDRILLRSY
jgi:hypothetical protein